MKRYLPHFKHPFLFSSNIALVNTSVPIGAKQVETTRNNIASVNTPVSIGAKQVETMRNPTSIKMAKGNQHSLKRTEMGEAKTCWTGHGNFKSSCS